MPRRRCSAQASRYAELRDRCTVRPRPSGDSEFDTDTAVRAIGSGWFAAQISDRWNALGGTLNGGYLLALALRAMAAETSAGTPLVASASYLAPAEPGEGELRATTLRAGRHLVTAEASAFQGDRHVLHAVATFVGSGAAGAPGGRGGPPPDVPAPEDCAEPLAGVHLPGVSITERIDYRFPEVPGWWTGRPSGNASVDVWMRFRDGRPADPLALALLVDAAPPAVLDVGVPSSTTVQLTVHLRARPVPGWLLAHIGTRHVIDGYHEEDVEIWDGTGRLVAQSRQLAVLPGGLPQEITRNGG